MKCFPRRRGGLMASIAHLGCFRYQLATSLRHPSGNLSHHIGCRPRPYGLLAGYLDIARSRCRRATLPCLQDVPGQCGGRLVHARRDPSRSARLEHPQLLRLVPRALITLG